MVSLGLHYTGTVYSLWGICNETFVF